MTSKILSLSIAILLTLLSEVSISAEKSWRGIDSSQVRIGMEIELFPKRLQYLLPFLKVGPKLLKKYSTAERAAQALIDSGEGPFEWKDEAPLSMKNFEVGLDGDVVELRLKHISGIKEPLQSFKAITDQVQATQLLFKDILKDDVTEGIEYHIHLSFNDLNQIPASRVKSRLKKLNRLFLLEYLALGADRDAALTVNMENYQPDISARGIFRYLDGNHFEMRWHHTSPDKTIKKVIDYMLMDDDAFKTSVKEREAFLLKKQPDMIERISSKNIQTFIDAFFKVPDSPLSYQNSPEWLKSNRAASDSELLKALKSPDRSLRLIAALLLSNRGGKNTNSMIRVALKDKDPVVRNLAAKALIGHFDSETDSLFRMGIYDSDPTVVASTANALRRRNDPKTYLLLEEMLKSSDPALNRYASEAISTFKGENQIKLIELALKARDSLARINATHALSESLYPESEPLFDLALKDRSTAVRIEAAKRLTWLSKPYYPIIKIALHDKSPEVRKYAANSLRWKDRPDVVELYKLALLDKSVATRAIVFEYLNHASGPRAYEIMKIGLSDPSPKVRKAAAEQLYCNQPSNFEKLFRIAIKDSNPQVKFAAIGGLSQIKDKDLPAIVKTLMSDRDPKIRERTLYNLQDRQLSPATLNAIRVGLLDPLNSIRFPAIDLLMKFEDPSIFELIDLVYNDKDPIIRSRLFSDLADKTNPKIIEVMHKALTDPSPEVRIELARALSYVNNPKTLILKKKLLTDSNIDVRKAVASELNQFENPDNLKLLKAALKDPVEEVRISAIFTLNACKEVICLKIYEDLFPKASPKMREALISTLSKNSPEAIQLMQKLYETSNEEIPYSLFLKLADLDPKLNLKYFEQALLKDENSYARRNILNKLAYRKEPEALDIIALYVESDDLITRISAVTSLKGRTDTKSYELMLKSLRDPDIYVRKTAVSAVSGRTTKEIIRVLKLAILDPAIEVRSEAVNQLKWSEDPEILKLFEIALSDPYSVIRNAAFNKVTDFRKFSPAYLRRAAQDPLVEIQRQAKIALEITDSSQCLTTQLEEVIRGN